MRLTTNCTARLRAAIRPAAIDRGPDRPHTAQEGRPCSFGDPAGGYHLPGPSHAESRHTSATARKDTAATDTRPGAQAGHEARAPELGSTYRSRRRKRGGPATGTARSRRIDVPAPTHSRRIRRPCSPHQGPTRPPNRPSAGPRYPAESAHPRPPSTPRKPPATNAPAPPTPHPATAPRPHADRRAPPRGSRRPPDDDMPTTAPRTLFRVARLLVGRPQPPGYRQRPTPRGVPHRVAALVAVPEHLSHPQLTHDCSPLGHCTSTPPRVAGGTPDTQIPMWQGPGAPTGRGCHPPPHRGHGGRTAMRESVSHQPAG